MIDVFLTMIAEGLPTCHACAMAGLSYNTVRTWLNPKHKQYRASLHSEVKKARATCVMRHIEKLNASEDWRAHAFWLERMTVKFSSNKAKVHDQRDNESSESVLLANLSPRKSRKLAAAHDAMMERLTKQERDNVEG
jgi:hypothetical protein